MASTGETQSIRVGDRQFHITGNLGKGGFSVVKKAFDDSTRKRVALKVMFTDEFKSQRERDVNINQAHKEIKAMRQLQHPNIVRLYGYDLNATFENRSSIILVQELAMGGELFNYLLFTGKFSESLSQYVFSQLMAGLKQAHDAGLAHRDLKPENILLDKHFQIKIADFGFAYAYMKNGEISNMRTELGTRGYMAPEISRTHDYDHKVDYFASGVILFILLSGFPPFKTTENSDWWFDKVDQGKTDLFWMAHERKVAFSSPAKTLIDGLLRTDPAKRFDMAQIQSSEFLTAEPLMAKEEFAREMKGRYRAVAQGKSRGTERDAGTVKELLEEITPEEKPVLEMEFLLQNEVRQGFFDCKDNEGFQKVLELIGEQAGEGMEKYLEQHPPTFQSAEACQQLGSADNGEEVAALLGVEQRFGETVHSLMKETNYGEVPDYKEACQYLVLEQQALPAYEDDYHGALAGCFDIRCGMGTVAYSLKGFLANNNGQLEVDMVNKRLNLCFEKAVQGEVPVSATETMQYTEQIIVLMTINFYSSDKFNKMVIKKLGSDFSGVELYKELLGKMTANTQMQHFLVVTEDEDEDEN